MDQSLQNLQNQFLKELRENKTPIFIFLVNGVRLHGCVEFFDNYIVAVRSEVTQLVYKHSISTVMPAGAGTPHTGQRKEHDGKPQRNDTYQAFAVKRTYGKITVKSNSKEC